MKDYTGQLFGGSWTEKKLEILKRYLDAYNTALKNQPFERVYIDAFAGTGYRQQREEQYNSPTLFKEMEQEESQEFLKGSAKLALESDPPFHRFYFVESDLDKIKQLEKLRDAHPSQKDNIHIEQNDANVFIRDYCTREDWKNTRAVLFLDPFATQVEWITMEAIASTKSIDVWVLFPVMAVNRLLTNDPQKIFNNCLKKIFGTDEWFESFYKTRKLNDIFGRSFDKIEKACDFKSIGNFYKNRLKNIFSGVSEDYKVFNNSTNSALFIFFFAVGNDNPKAKKLALKIAQYLLSKNF